MRRLRRKSPGDQLALPCQPPVTGTDTVPTSGPAGPSRWSSIVPPLPALATRASTLLTPAEVDVVVVSRIAAVRKSGVGPPSASVVASVCTPCDAVKLDARLARLASMVVVPLAGRSR